jgi:hypothetical protein
MVSEVLTEKVGSSRSVVGFHDLSLVPECS